MEISYTRGVRIYTKTGDDGTTGQFYGGRVAKDDLRVEAAGTIDETVAALGLARASATDPALGDLILRLQRELFVAGAEIATAPENWPKLAVDKGTKVDAAMVSALEEQIDSLEAQAPMPREFVIPGNTQAGAALDLSRATVRRCERRCVALAREGALPDGEVVRYLNRMADLLFVMARYDEAGWTPLHES